MITVQSIQGATAAYFGQPVVEMRSQRRGRAQARPRQIAMYLARQLTPLSLPAIGMMFGNRDHTTVLHAIERVESLIRCDVEVAHAITDIKGVLASTGERMPQHEFAVHVEVIVGEIRKLLLGLYPRQTTEGPNVRDS